MTAFFGYSVPGSTRKISWKILLGIAISITALAIVLYRINWRVLADSIGRASICFLFLGVLFFLCDLTMRSWRWQILLRPLGRYGLFKDSFPFYMIGYMANMTLLLRAGEIIRPYMFGKEYNVSKSGVFATVVVERLADMVFIAAMLLIIAGVMDIPLRVKQSAAIAGGIGILSFIVLWVLALDRRSGNRVNELLKRLPKGIYKRLERIIAAATSSLNNVFGLLMLSLSSVAVWTCGFFTIRSYLLAFGLQLPWYSPIFIMVVANLGMMVPSSPGFVGVAHFLYVFSLSFFGVDKSTALAFAIVVHAVSFVIIVLIGLLSLWSKGLSFSEVAHSRRI